MYLDKLEPYSTSIFWQARFITSASVFKGKIIAHIATQSNIISKGSRQSIYITKTRVCVFLSSLTGLQSPAVWTLLALNIVLCEGQHLFLWKRLSWIYLIQFYALKFKSVGGKISLVLLCSTQLGLAYALYCSA